MKKFSQVPQLTLSAHLCLSKKFVKIPVVTLILQPHNKTHTYKSHTNKSQFSHLMFHLSATAMSL